MGTCVRETWSCSTPMWKPSIVIATVAVLVLSFMAGVAFSPVLVRPNGTTTTVSTKTEFPTQSCVLSEGAEIDLQVVNSLSGYPIPSVPVDVQWQTGLCGPTQVSADLGIYKTNSTGQIEIRFIEGGYTFTVEDAKNYTVQVGGTCGSVELSIPSGLQVHNCGVVTTSTSTNSG